MMKVSVRALCRSLKNVLKFNRTFDIIDGGTCGMELLDAMANREHLIIVDAVLANKQPGEIIVLHDEQVLYLFLSQNFATPTSAFVMYFCDEIDG